MIPQHLVLNSGPLDIGEGPAFASYEAEFQSRLQPSIRISNRARSVNWRLAAEFNVGQVIPDLVFVAFNTSRPANLWPTRWTYLHARVVSELRIRAPLTIPSISSRAGIRQERTREIIDSLLVSGAIESENGNSFYLAHGLKRQQSYSIAIELKLERWRDAARQASAYLEFCDSSAVILAKATDASIRRIQQEAREIGIGAFLANRCGLMELAPIPTTRIRRPNAHNEYVVASALTMEHGYWLDR